MDGQTFQMSRYCGEQTDISDEQISTIPASFYHHKLFSPSVIRILAAVLLWALSSLWWLGKKTKTNKKKKKKKENKEGKEKT